EGDVPVAVLEVEDAAVPVGRVDYRRLMVVPRQRNRRPREQVAARRDGRVLRDRAHAQAARQPQARRGEGERRGAPPLTRHTRWWSRGGTRSRGSRASRGRRG